MRTHTPLPPALARYAVDGRKTKGTVLTPLDCFDDVLTPVRELVLPFNLDAEYVDNLARSGPLDGDILEGRTGVTVQIRGVAEAVGTIFARPEQATLAEETGRPLRHPVVESPTVVVDWLRLRGVDCDVFADIALYKSLRKTCRLQLCAHFALADVAFLAGTGEFEDTIADLFKTRKLTMGRRLVARSSGHARARSGSTPLSPWVIRFGDHYYRLSLEIVDTSGLHGIAGYATLAKNVGVRLEAKDAISRQGPGADIARMDEIYFEKPEDFDAYALGDLHVSDIVYANENLWGDIWTALGIPHRRVPPRLTIGATVADLLKNRMAEAVGAALDDDVDDFTQATTGTHNAGTLSRFARSKNPLALLAKVDGGRCRNAKPTLTTMAGTLADIDIAGAYASAMTATPLVFGRVRTSSYGNARDLAADLRPCPTLGEWLRCHENRLLDRTWFARISTREPFTFESDLIPSWVGYRVTTALSDSEVQGMDVLMDPASGEMRYFGREIWSGTLTSDLLDVARTTMSTRQFEEWTSKTVVRSAIYVDQKDFVPVDEYRRLFKSGKLDDFTWTSLTLGELVSDVARANRKRVQKEFGKGTPLDTLYKLVSNTLYGDSVSRHFGTSSVISGSNVTGTVRAFMFLAEKGLNLVGSITDGQLFDLNRVLHCRPHVDRRRPESSETRKPADLALGVRAYLLTPNELTLKGESRLAPLVGKKLETRWTGDTLELVISHVDGRREIVSGVEAVKTWVDETAYEHLCRLWPNSKLLSENYRVVDGLNLDGSVKYREQKGLFRFETKEIISRAAFHGSANYLHVPAIPTGKTKIKMRSFEANREHLAFTLDGSGELTYLDTYVFRSPADVLLRAIETDPRRVPILPPFTKTRILKPGVYSPKPVDGRRVVSRYQSYGVVLLPGDSVFVLGRPRLFSLAQFTFQSRSQYENWRRTTSRLVNRDGLSFEQWFTNPDGLTVDYLAMVEAVDHAINLGVVDPVRHFSQVFRRRLDPSVIAFHRATKAMATHLNGRLGADETGYLDYDPSDDFAGFAGREYA